MKTIVKSTIIAVTGMALSLAAAAPAHAVNGDVYSKALAPGTSVGGGSMKAYVSFNSSDHTKVTFKSVYVNDICDGNGNGDGNYAGGRAVVQYTDGTRWYGAFHRDPHTCGSAAYFIGDLPFDGSKAIDNAGVQALVMDGTSSTILSRGPIDWRDNQYTVPK